jgi:hypothetical protein
VVVYYVIALALYMRSSYREVLRCLLEGVQWLLDPSVSIRVAGKSGISQARTRLGAEPVRALYEATVAPIAETRTRGAWYRQWRLMSLDGSTLDVADTKENEEAFGRPGASRGRAAFPKIRFVALLENGTHVLWAARVDKYATDELTLAEEVVPALRKGMLCLAERFFPSHKLWQQAAATGADLLWRTRQNARLEIDRRLPDGSYLSRIYPSTSDRRNQRKAIVVRVIDYRLDKVSGCRAYLSFDHHHPGSQTGSRQRIGRALSRALGDRNRFGRVEDSFARSPDRAAEQDAGTRETGILRSADGALCDSRPDARSGLAGRRRSGPPIVSPRRSRCPTAYGPLRRYFPLSTEKLCMRRSSTKFFRSVAVPAATGSILAA